MCVVKSSRHGRACQSSMHGTGLELEEAPEINSISMIDFLAVLEKPHTHAMNASVQISIRPSSSPSCRSRISTYVESSSLQSMSDGRVLSEEPNQASRKTFRR